MVHRRRCARLPPSLRPSSRGPVSRRGRREAGRRHLQLPVRGRRRRYELPRPCRRGAARSASGRRTPPGVPHHLARRAADEADHNDVPQPDVDGRRGVYSRMPFRFGGAARRLRQNRPGPADKCSQRRRPRDHASRRTATPAVFGGRQLGVGNLWRFVDEVRAGRMSGRIRITQSSREPGHGKLPTCPARIASNPPMWAGKSASASPTWKWTGTPLDTAFCFARSIMRGETSTPVTSYPRSASRTASDPVPQPMSKIRAGAGGSNSSSSVCHAVRITGSVKPWSGCSSKPSAATSHSLGTGTRQFYEAERSPYLRHTMPKRSSCKPFALRDQDPA